MLYDHSFLEEKDVSLSSRLKWNTFKTHWAAGRDVDGPKQSGEVGH